MKKIILTIVEVIVIVAVLLYVVNQINQNDEGKLNDKNKIENELRSANLLLEQRLGASERQRLVLDDSITCLNHTITTLVRTSTRLDSLLTTVKGKYKDRSVTQLEIEMINRWQGK